MDTQPCTSPPIRSVGEEWRGMAREDMSLGAAAMVAGVGLLVMMIFAGVAFSLFESMVVVGDAAQTARNIADNELLFRVVPCAFLIVAILDVVVAWALYVFLAPVDRSLALLAAWLRVAMAAVFAASLVGLFAAVRLASEGQSGEMVMMSVNAFNDGWDAALAFFGLHLIALGYLAAKSGYVPKVLGVLVMFASVDYLIDSFGSFLVSGYGANVALFTFVGEALLMV